MSQVVPYSDPRGAVEWHGMLGPSGIYRAVPSEVRESMGPSVAILDMTVYVSDVCGHLWKTK